MFSYKTLIRDKLTDDATVKTRFTASATGSCNIFMEHLRMSATYPQILIGYDGGETRPGLDADEGRITLTIEAKGSGALHAHKELGQLRSAILAVIDDTAIGSSTGAVAYHVRKFSEIEGYDDREKFHWLRMSFSTEFLQNTSNP